MLRRATGRFCFGSGFPRALGFNQTRACVLRVNPTSEYIPSKPDQPRYSLKRFNMQLSQSVFCRSPNLERTQTVYRVMEHDGVKGDHITFFILFSAILEHEVWELVRIHHLSSVTLKNPISFQQHTIK